MLFRDLVVCNREWEKTMELVVVFKDSSEAVFIGVHAARFFYGNRQVLWFRDRVVMLQ